MVNFVVDRFRYKELMKDVIDSYRNAIIQIATPYTRGTGFYLSAPHLIVTNEHVVRDNREVVVESQGLSKQLARVLYLDPKYDLAFLEVPDTFKLPEIKLAERATLSEGDVVLAMGHPFGFDFSAKQGIVSNRAQDLDDVTYIHHDAALNPGNSGGPLVDQEGKVVGVNTFIAKDGNNIGFSLPVEYLINTIEEFKKGSSQEGARCFSCLNLVFQSERPQKYCPYCGAKVQLPSQAEVYEAVGVARTIEELLKKANYDVRFSRRGPNNWEIEQGSAKILISYYERTGLIVGDAYLCVLPKQNIEPIYEYLLRQNYEMSGLTFSINPKGHEVILSLLIYDKYLNVDTGMKLFQHLFVKADYYDNILVEKYGARWKEEKEMEN